MTAVCKYYKQHRNLFKDVNKERLIERLIIDLAMDYNTASENSTRKETTIAIVNICNCVFTVHPWLFFAAISDKWSKSVSRCFKRGRGIVQSSAWNKHTMGAIFELWLYVIIVELRALVWRRTIAWILSKWITKGFIRRWMNLANLSSPLIFFSVVITHQVAPQPLASVICRKVKLDGLHDLCESNCHNSIILMFMKFPPCTDEWNWKYPAHLSGFCFSYLACALLPFWKGESPT